ncbi:hypothetical protein Ancab_019509 [Ancistrocladus abbreviatus]
MQSLFSIKDEVSKIECRQISARYGVTVTQVRQYFASQRSRVKKAVLMSKDRAINSAACKEAQDGVPASSDSMMPVDPVPLSSIAPSSAEEAASCLKLEEILKGLNEPEKMFVNTIFNLMREADTFAREMALMEKILEMKNPSVLCWFLNNGGLMILATWLSDATTEEQTTVLAVALKALSHLPLHKALPAHMSAIIQGVNRLRFYRTPGIADKARSLLARWSKILAKSHALRGHNRIASSSDTPKQIDLKQITGTFVGDESWESAVDLPEDIIASSYGNSVDTRNGKTQVKLLMASSDDSNKKHVLGFRNKERRKVLLVDQPGQKAIGKSQQVSKVAPTSQGRPITADEIQKAKLRAQVMQSKHAKAGSSSNDSQSKKSEGQKRPSSLLTGDLLLASEVYLRPKLEAQKKARLVPPPPKDTKQLESVDDKKLDSELKVQIKWQTPPEICINPDWRVGTGADSKEVDVQRSRTRRERETVYQTPEDIPLNAKEPWDIEMDYDDSLTIEIPVEQLPEGTPLEPEPTPGTSSQPGSSSAPPEPDLELLAVLLKNPDLVFALTSGQASGLSGDETVKLLDMIKSGGGAGGLGAPAGIMENRRVEVSLPSPTPVRNIEVSLPSPTPLLPFRAEASLPSPTPSSYPAPSGSRMEAVKNPFSRQTPLASGSTPVGCTTALNSNRLQATSSVQPQLPSQNVVTHQQSSISSLADRLHAAVPPPSLTRSSAPPPLQMNSTPLQSLPPQNPIAQNPSQVVPTRNIPHPSLPMPPESTPLELHHRSQLQQSHSFLTEPVRYPQHINGPKMNSSSLPESWHARDGLPSRSYSHINHQHNLNKIVGASVLHPSLPSPSWQRNETDFESWSPENSPRARHRDQMQTHGWNQPQQRRNFGRGDGPPDWSRHQSSWGNRGWHEYDRRR